jgi:UDP-2,3-diacylglucosamine hydrolase
MIGLIFGENDFPKEILKKIKEKYLIIDLTKKKNYIKNRNSYQVSIGQFGKILKILKDNNCKKVLFAGNVSKPNFKKIKLDFKGVYYIAKIIRKAKIGDAALLKEIINIFKKEKIKTISSLSFTPQLSLKKGVYTKIKPNKFDKTDIKKAISCLNKQSAYNNVQAVVSRNNKIEAIESKSGTQKMLQKIKIFKRNKIGVLVKFPKKKQDLRIDLPTVGLSTLKQCKSVGLKGLVLKSNQNVFLDKIKSIKYANKKKMFISVH